jgi:hypothetical protein
MKKQIASLLMVVCVVVASCDDNDNSPTGTGPGSGNPIDQSQLSGNALAQSINANAGDGFCSPQGGGQFGDASWASSSTAKIDMDGDPNAAGHDTTWDPNTTGQINGHAVNSSQYAYVVMSPQQMASNGVQIGDWAKVTNNATGQTVWARVEDKGPAGGTGEISEAAANGVGIQFQQNSFTVGNPSVTVQAFADTASIQGDCVS